MRKSYSSSETDEKTVEELSTEKRDEAILDVVIRAFSFQYEMRQRLDSKLNNFVAITATITALNSGIAFFVLDEISTGNPFYLPLIFVFFIGTGFLVGALVKGLLGYKPTKYTIYPEDPKRLIEEYKDFSKTHVVRVVAASLASATNANEEVNAKKSRAINWVFYLIVFAIFAMLVFTVFMIFALGVPTPVDP